jgi:hypothetical protein
LPAARAEPFNDTRYQTLIARLLLNARGVLVRGELADAEGTTLVRFVGQDGLLEAVRAYLARCEAQADSEPLAPGAAP